nr:MAG TPA_asm: hypothetical protein [Caudoviricetes sp.]
MPAAFFAAAPTPWLSAAYFPAPPGATTVQAAAPAYPSGKHKEQQVSLAALCQSIFYREFY